ncbi:glutathione binding-like protein [Sphingomonas cannabina]|uniref:glutathione binding-like protein n=1 Tax=Sphingomonas cannabina TaxID=2899123 RepID=UPI001F40AB78|nr:glutathione binding-like protein [Sphingomonas cannabina]UIJ45406.1 glutathione binding-like protein [Sphingomonas cannabina]
MKLYFIPFACSLATRIAVIEAELDADFVQVTPDAVLADGRPFRTVSPMGYVPALETEAGVTLTEGAAVLSYIADLAAEGVLAPPLVSDERYRMTMWLNFVATELHKSVFAPLMGRAAGPEERAAAKARAARPFAVLEAHFTEGRPFLVDTFSVADAYLLAVLNWCEHAGVPIDEWQAVKAWRGAMRRRPSVAQAMAEEMPLLKAA